MSGIYIPGMEMPKNCDCCDFMEVRGEYGEPDCPFGLIIRCASEKHPDCPLVPVPDHGDLIDRDPFVQFIKSHWDSSDQWFVEQLEARPAIVPDDKEGEG